MPDAVFPEGISVKDPHENAPDYVRALLSIKKSELIPWLESLEGDWSNFEIKRSKKGSLYIQLNTWKPKKAVTSDSDASGGDSDGLPF